MKVKAVKSFATIYKTAMPGKFLMLNLTSWQQI